MSNYLFLDFETRNRLDLKTAGLDNYSRSAEPLLLSYKSNQGPTKLWQIHKEWPMPFELEDRLLDPNWIKIAWHAQFERTILKNAPCFQGAYNIPINQWRDPMILARSLSMPGSLDAVSKILKMGDKGKKEGKKLIALFTVPRPIRKRKKQIEIDFPGEYNDWNSHPKEWAEFETYNIQDTEVEADLWYKFLPLSFPEQQWEDYFLDQEINDFGLPVNVERAEKALRLAERYKAWAFEELKRMTGLENPNSPKHQLLPWLQAQGYPWGSVNKQFTEPLIKQLHTEGGNCLTMEANEVLELRAKSSQSSYTKLERLLAEVGPDNMLRYQFSYMGASRTGRQSSHGFQAQNMPRPIKAVKKNPERALQLVDSEDYDTIMKENDSILPFVASVIRMCIEVKE